MKLFSVEILSLCKFLSFELNGFSLDDFLLQNIDPVKFIESAEEQGIFSVYGEKLLKAIENNQPDFDTSVYFIRLKKQELRSFNLSTRLLRILNDLKSENITAVPVKGPVFSEYLYGDCSKRTYADLDIFIYKKDLYSACKILEENGYEPDFKLSYKKFKKFADHEYDFKLYNKNTHTIVELHWELSGRYTKDPIELDNCFKEIKISKILNKKVNKLPDRLEFIYLCIHSAKHCFEKLEMIYSIAAYYEKFMKNDEKEVLNLAKDMKCLKAVVFSIYLCREFLDLSTGKNVELYFSKYNNFNLLKDKVVHFIENRNRLSETRFSGFHIRLGDSFYTKLILRLRLIFTPTCKEWRYFNIPVNLSFLYFFIRPVRLFYNYLIKGFKGNGL